MRVRVCARVRACVRRYIHIVNNRSHFEVLTMNTNCKRYTRIYLPEFLFNQWSLRPCRFSLHCGSGQKEIFHGATGGWGPLGGVLIHVLHLGTYTRTQTKTRDTNQTVRCASPPKRHFKVMFYLHLHLKILYKYNALKRTTD